MMRMKEIRMPRRVLERIEKDIWNYHEEYTEGRTGVERTLLVKEELSGDPFR